MDGSGRIGIGSPINRVDGLAKVTGQARYAAEHPVAGLLYGVVVSSAIAKGRITAIDETRARAVRGVVEVLTHENRPHTAWFDSNYQDEVGPPGSPFRPLYDDKVQFSGQPVALVLAETFEAARDAASLVELELRARAAQHRFRQRRWRRNFCPPRSATAIIPPKDARRRRGGVRGRAAEGCGRISSGDRASQSDGDARQHGHLRRRRQAHGL